MTDLSIGVAAYSVQNPKASQKYGQLALLPVLQGAQDVLLRVSLAGIPKDATILSAVMRFAQGAAVTGTHSLNLYRVTGAWPSSVTWSTLPTFTATGTVLVSKVAPAAGTVWGFDITALVQTLVSGTNPNIGFLLAKNQATRITFNGTPASSGKPVLVVSYTLAPATPSNLNPASGSVSLAKPTLTFDADDDILKLQVQIDPAANGVSPAFDTGDVDAAAGLLDLTTTAYAGLSNAATTSWRARQKNANGYSPWSSWATFTRTNKSAVTITAPSTGAITDGTPPVTWTFGGTQRSWQARLLDSHGNPISDSGRQIGTATSWTPTKGLTSNGATGTIEVRVWDNVDRESTAGDPPYAVVTLAVTLTLGAGVTPVTDLAVAQDGVSPVVHLSGHLAAVPDEMRVFVNGVQVASYVGVDVFTGTAFTIPDVSAPMNLAATYRVAPVVNGVVASGGNTVTYTPKCAGMWLIDESDHTAAVVIWGDDDQEQDQPEIAIEHTPISDGDDQVQVIRRRLVRYPPQGTIVGELLSDTMGVDVVACEANIRAWADYDAGHLFRLVLGNMNRTVIIGYLVFAEPALTGPANRILDVTFKWWSQV